MNVQLDFAAVLAEWPLLLTGVAWTLGLTMASVGIGMLLGIGGAWVRARGFGADRAAAWLQTIVTAYVELIRNTPFIVQLFFIFFGLPAAGFKLSAEMASLIAMVVNLGAYSTEIIRAGLEATPKGQIEAAQSLALSRRQIFIWVALPPALQKMWPSLVSQIIIVMLGSSVCGQISTEELSYAADLIQSRNFRSFEAFIVIGALYLLLSVMMRYALNWLGATFLFGRR
ncbi:MULTISPECIES: amino acid ABC transporter permease [unclassified Undibacterium]|uniref:amino acid ABC transporter permease n=1 Tax=unclassified Undibacterium TaxID=2630295 RepID=UPI002AC92DB3|nr:MULTISPECIES: amino acid ABC transporter permease [unclassified Undibacterium]MEB0140653.1 amino acid ABC transporter permease [Undibacterium sp. CCC2.1]MEB0172417.1 amino acid ABC transporter permease [Undibacterium sp. CCC1.1]MEB0177693.1 amino acid ABC transporter permease [Undibacterium sp. CCC3.4]MEB0215539.1 amino acid ABC transporter permease [Undibacterium sp. 5I2]WPX43753.1 amino acid ABC transporter permease [Undibacterium sp. CCC3.4]